MSVPARRSRGGPAAIGALVALVACTGSAPAAYGQDTIASTAAATPVSSYRGWLAWSDYDAATRRFRLVARRGGVTTPVPVAPRRVPFDVDLGPDAHGDVSAVYSRCAVEPNRGDPRVRQWAAGTPQWSTGRRCNLHKFTFATGRETRIAAANTPRSSEFLPSIWKDRVAFARVYTGRSGVAGRRAHLYHRAISGARASLGLPEPPRARAGVVEPGPSALDLVGRRLAVAWETRREEPISEIDLVTIGEGRRLVERVGSGEIQTVNLVSAGMRAGRLYYGQGEFGDSTSGELRRYRIRTGRYETAPASSTRTLLATAPAARGVLGLISGGVQAGCSSESVSDAGTVLTAPCELVRFASIDWRRHTPRRFGLR